jgi:DNA-binding GntR family transcriptional regulator
MTLDRSSPMPLWAQLEALLEQRLESGDITERFPTDTELVDEYQVSRHTVREAVRHLNRTGILRRERGRGTKVNRAEFEQPLGALYSLFRSIESSGVEQRSEVLALRETTNEAAAQHLELDPDAPLVFLERLRCAGGEPLAIDRTWVPMAIGAPLLESNFERTALYDEMERLCGFRPATIVNPNKTLPRVDQRGETRRVDVGRAEVVAGSGTTFRVAAPLVDLSEQPPGELFLALPPGAGTHYRVQVRRASPTEALQLVLGWLVSGSP